MCVYIMRTWNTIIGALYLCPLRLGFTPPEITCAEPLGIESGKVPSSAMTSSSDYNQYCQADRGRLNEVIEGSYYGGWSPQTSSASRGQFLQIDLGQNVKVTRIATQGRYNVGWWTKTYTLSYRIQGGSTFESYSNGQVNLNYYCYHHHHCPGLGEILLS